MPKCNNVHPNCNRGGTAGMAMPKVAWPYNVTVDGCFVQTVLFLGRLTKEARVNAEYEWAKENGVSERGVRFRENF